MRNASRLLFILLFFTLSVLIVACSSTTNNQDKDNESGSNNKEAEVEDITIKWVYPWGAEHFMDMMGNDIEDKFPHVTIEVLDANADHSESLENLLASKEIPDIITVGQSAQISILYDLDLAANLDALIEKTDFNLEQIEPTIVQYIRNLDPNREGGLYAIPHSRPMWALHYDKNIFDKLGENYPEDGMTWDEVLELAKRLTREMDGVQYRGLDLDVWGDAFQQFSENTVDPDTDEVLIAKSEPVKRFLEYINQVVSIPGNYPVDEPSSALNHWGELLEEGNVAMYPSRVDLSALQDDTKNIDIVTYPSWEGYEGLNPNPNGASWIITEPSEHKEELLKIIDYMLSEEVQMKFSQEGNVEGGASVLVNPDVHDAFGSNHPALDDKNIASLFINKYATGPEKRPNYSDNVLWSAPNKFVDSGQDINEFMRILQEEAEENIRSEKASE